MKRTIWLILISVLMAGLVSAQAARSTTIRIGTTSQNTYGPEFMVDGQRFTGTQVFVWPEGSKHIVQFLLSVNGDGDVLPYQSNDFTDQIRWSFSGWKDNQGLLVPSSSTIQTITATPLLTSLIAQVNTTYRVHIQYFNSPGPGSCSGAPADPTANNRYGIVYIESTCVSTSADFWMPAGNIKLSAYPFTGYLFTGWMVNGNALPNSFLNTYYGLLGYNLTGPVNLIPVFMPAKRVSFRTNPPGLTVLVDHVPLNTPPAPPTLPLPGTNVGAPCVPDYTRIPVTAPAGVVQLCLGDFDFLPGSTHAIGATIPQMDRTGVYWVFSQFSNGLKNNDLYKVDELLNQVDVVTANFVRGARTTIITNPSGLRLSVDGRENWPSYNFVWGQGETHTLGAAATQRDSKGRTYKFIGWSNQGNATQTIKIPEGVTDISFAATYQIQPQVQLTSNPSGLTLTIDGQTCTTPCVLDRDPGTSVQIGAPATIAGSSGIRYDFAGWSDNNSSTSRSVNFATDTQSLTVNYTTMVKLTTVSEPANSAAFRLSPPSPDGYFPVGTQVSITAAASGGFKFLRWDGDIVSSFASGFLVMDQPRSARAIFNRVPFIAPAGIRNAAGDTPDGSVAPGSIIAIYGENLTDQLLVGRSNPLAQAIGDVTVTVSDRLLPLLFVSPQQINAQVPSGLPDGEYTLKVQWVGHPDVSGTFTISRNAPGLYTRANDLNEPLVLATHEDGSAVTRESPARRNETITIYGNGFGPYDRSVIDGFLIPPSELYNVTDSVTVNAGESSYTPLSARAAENMVGTTVVQLKIADGMPGSATLDLTVTVNGKSSNRVQLPVE